ncbi:hypothetical protein Aab01nite_12130 [Paractinoplanes abujensis]|uniref:Glycine zipper family protein n=1 Tax=Paractinoplanes abujensis TaxID=882441 RepID=A0A7W7CME7_9ACTN|nr:hypothetical protein [Actinoplanes abujensis]GID17623.1 hypothetical protein Aab01nite_12130 [Actinoplanes abujensis]
MWGIPAWAWGAGLAVGCAIGLLMFDGAIVGLIFGISIGTAFAISFGAATKKSVGGDGQGDGEDAPAGGDGSGRH